MRWGLARWSAVPVWKGNACKQFAGASLCMDPCTACMGCQQSCSAFDQNLHYQINQHGRIAHHGAMVSPVMLRFPCMVSVIGAWQHISCNCPQAAQLLQWKTQLCDTKIWPDGCL